MSDQPYTDPQIVRAKTKWYVKFYYQNPYNKDRWDRFRYYGKLNNKRYINNREFNAEYLRSQLLMQLRQGKIPQQYSGVPKDFIREDTNVNAHLIMSDNHGRPSRAAREDVPFTDLKLPEPVAPVKEKAASMKMFETLQKIAKGESLGKSGETLNALTLYINRLKKYFKFIMREKAVAEQTEFDEAMLEDLVITDLDAEKALDFRSWMIEEMELSNASVNSTLGTIKRFYQVCVNLKQLGDNPFAFVKLLPKKRGVTYTAFTTEEKDLIVAHLKQKNPDLYLFANLIYTCFIRPKELCALKLSDFDLQRGFVQVLGENAKGAHTSFRQIMPSTREILLKMNVLKYPTNEPIFSKICGNDKSLRIRRRKVTELWRRTVKETLGIDKEMYALKHTGNVDYFKSLDNIGQANLQWLQHQNDHTDLAITQHYLHSLVIIKMKEEDIKHAKF